MSSDTERYTHPVSTPSTAIVSTKMSGTYFELDEEWDDPGWTRIPNGIARCTTISRRLKGWILECASHARGRRMTFAEMLGASTDGRDATYATIKEGIEAGYVTRSRGRDDSGRLGVVVYRLHVAPQPAKPEGPLPGFPDMAEPDVVEPDVAKPETSKKTRSSLEDQEDLEHLKPSPPASRSASSSPPGQELLDFDEPAKQVSETNSSSRVQDQERHGGDQLAILRPDVEQLCTLLRDLITRNGSKPPVITKGWQDAARLLLDLDERPLNEALWLIKWCQNDEFWRANIGSMPTFRKKYDQLRLKARATWNGRRSTRVATTDQRVASIQALKGTSNAGCYGGVSS